MEGRGGRGDSYGGHRGASHRGRGRGRGTGRDGHSVWGWPAPYPTSVVCLQTLCMCGVFDFTQWGVSAWCDFSDSLESCLQQY